MSIKEQLKYLCQVQNLKLKYLEELSLLSSNARLISEKEKSHIGDDQLELLNAHFHIPVQFAPNDFKLNLSLSNFTLQEDWIEIGKTFFKDSWDNLNHAKLPNDFLNDDDSISLENKKLFLHGIIKEMLTVNDPYHPHEYSSEMYIQDWSPETLESYGIAAFMVNTLMLSEKLPIICSNFPYLMNEFERAELKLTPRAFDMIRGDLIDLPFYQIFKDAGVIKKSFIFNFPVNGVTPETF